MKLLLIINKVTDWVQNFILGNNSLSEHQKRIFNEKISIKTQTSLKNKTNKPSLIDNGTVVGRKTMRLVRNQKGRSVMLSHDYGLGNISVGTQLQTESNRNSDGLIIAYYISKFNHLAYDNLGFGTMTDTHKAIGKILNINPNTIKNMRDDFDPLHDNGRVGWYQKPLTKSRLNVIDLYQNHNQENLHKRVLDLLDISSKRVKPDNEKQHIIKDKNIIDNKKSVKVKLSGKYKSIKRGKEA